MIIKIRVLRRTARAAVMQELGFGDEIKSKSDFIKIVRAYVSSMGDTSIDDHEIEYGEYQEEADNIVNKYFKP